MQCIYITYPWHKEGLFKLLFDGWMVKECWSGKVAEWWGFTGCVGVLQGDRGKGHCSQRGCVSKAWETKWFPSRRAGGGWQWEGSWAWKQAPCCCVFFLTSIILLLFSFKLLPLPCLCFQCKLFWSSVSLLPASHTATLSPFLPHTSHLFLHYSGFNKNIVYLLFCISFVTFC